MSSDVNVDDRNERIQGRLRDRGIDAVVIGGSLIIYDQNKASKLAKVLGDKYTKESQ